MSVVLLATLGLAWLTVFVFFLAACIAAGRADRTARTGVHSGGALPDRLVLVEREILRS
jgi:hypothetical protein